MAVAEEPELLECNRCGAVGTEENFYWFWSSKLNRRYRRPECKRCFDTRKSLRLVKQRIKTKLRKRVAECPDRALLKLIKAHPDLMTKIMQRYPGEYKKYLVEEMQSVISDVKKRSLITGKAHSRNIDYDSVWAEIEEEVRRTGRVDFDERVSHKFNSNMNVPKTTS